MKFLHSADWQLGCSYARFGDSAEQLCRERLQTLRRALEYARAKQVDAFIIAGNLFEDHQVAAELLRETHELFACFSDLRILLVPGNHDPASGPGSIWERVPFKQPPENVTVFREPATVEIADAFFLVNPLTQKRSAQDPTVELGRLAAQIRCDTIKVGITHGSPAIQGKHQLDDYPIALDAASRHGLDYLALGHWHSWLVLDEGRMVMPGTAEPDDFEQSGSGALVEIDGPGSQPRVERVSLAGVEWRGFRLDLVGEASSRALLMDDLRQWQERKDKKVVRVTLEGSGTRAFVKETHELLQPLLQGFLAVELKDQTRLRFGQAELDALSHGHPILVRVVNDLLGIQTLCTGRAPEVAIGEGALRPVEVRRWLEELGRSEEDLDESFFNSAAALLADKLEEV